MTQIMGDQLIDYLIELQKELNKVDIPLILGGGMSLYLRLQYLRIVESTRYPIALDVRSTNDLDLFLTADLIVDANKVESLRNTLTSLGYRVNPKAKNFQFVKTVNVFGSLRHINIDLLSAPPSEEQKSKVEVTKPRIKPHGVKGIHAYLTEEAQGIEIGKLEVTLPIKNKKTILVTIPSAYNYIILKLHAFNDRKIEPGPKSDLGRHHASDIFSTVIRMSEEDWSNALSHFKVHKDRSYIQNSIKIRKDCFSNSNSIGTIRLQENQSYRSNRATFDAYIQQFIQDMADLFP